MMKRVLISFLLVGLMTGCASTPRTSPSLNVSPVQDERIIYRSLIEQRVSMYRHEEAAKAVEACREVRQEKTAACAPQEPVTTGDNYFVRFGNESVVLDLDLNPVLPDIQEKTHYFVMGHSHGPSVVGNASLAQQRAIVVASWLSRNGIEQGNIHLLAAWSAHAEPYAPNLGVQVYALKNTSDIYLPLGAANGRS
ncbi:MAG: hypothetical protein K8F30_08630 [Taibaiella sp.]|nr:hypothetical protein [Taibaiella sp.]